jgi:hypothetical protein
VNLTWNTVTNATGYVVKRSTNSGGPYTPLSPNPTTNSFTDSSVFSGLTYYYVVSATSTGHEGLNSSQVSAALPTPPAAPTNLVGTAGNKAGGAVLGRQSRVPPATPSSAPPWSRARTRP